MAQTPEGKVKDLVKKFFKKYDIKFRMVVPCGYGQNGISDFVGILQGGTFIAVETKSNDTKKPTALQRKFLKEIEDAGGVAAVVGSQETLDKLEQLLIDKGLIEKI